MSADRLTDEHLRAIVDEVPGDPLGDAPWSPKVTRSLAREVRDLRAETAALRTLICEAYAYGFESAAADDPELAAVLDRTLEGDD